MKAIERIRARRRVAARHVDRKLLFRLRMFAVISAVLLGIIAYNVFTGTIGLGLAGLALCPGLVIGAIAGRMFKIFWHPDDQKVMSRLDKIGAAFLVLYVLVEIGRKKFFGHWLQGAQLNAFSFAFLAGLLFGRFLVMTKSVRRILKENDKLPSSTS